MRKLATHSLDSINSLQPKAFRPIDRNHHSRGVGVDFNWDAPHFIWLGKGVDDVELSQLFRRHLDQLWVGVVVGLPVPEERVANALVDSVDRGFIGHGGIVSEVLRARCLTEISHASLAAGRIKQGGESERGSLSS